MSNASYRSWPAGFATALVVCACQTVRRPASMSDRLMAAIGCYQLTSARTSEAEASRLRRIYLLADTLDAQHPSLHQVELLGDRPRDAALRRFQLWSIDSLSDTVRVHVGDGFTGQFFRGVPSSRGNFVGVTGTRGDAGPPFEHDVHPATLRRVACLKARI